MGSKQILVIDDDEIIRLVIQLTLKTFASWEVLIASSGLEGITIAQAEKPDAILLDMMMPDMDGFATIHQLHSQLKTQNIPIILVTAKTKMGETQKWKEIGVTGVITKPFEPSDLVPTMLTMLGWKEEA
ncbi:response regulator [Acaryochloris marina]|uniref:response regulator n=1 Tax=Acaryochloris marina TaxID=155978 RepID=UPI001BAE6A2C|nr:response regulator [Acaryochloris marina]QUY46009.1 response regulator [Acaryochloris marina S15]